MKRTFAIAGTLVVLLGAGVALPAAANAGGQADMPAGLQSVSSNSDSPVAANAEMPGAIMGLYAFEDSESYKDDVPNSPFGNYRAENDVTNAAVSGGERSALDVRSQLGCRAGFRVR